MAVPFVNSWAMGVVARLNGRGLALGYFFAPAAERIPTEPLPLDPTDAVHVELFGDPGLLRGEWKVVGPTPAFDRSKWPIPVFGHPILGVPGRGYRVTYDDRLTVTASDVVPVDQIAGLPPDRTAGYGALEMRLAQLLGQEARPADARRTGSQPPATLDSDDAMDWLGQLGSGDANALLTSAFSAATADEFLELRSAAAALAAAELVAAALGWPAPGLPDEAARWARRHRSHLSQDIADQARAAVVRVARRSELQELWGESPEAHAWDDAIADLKTRLST